MHELSIAQNIVEIASETLKSQKATKINSIIIEVGEVSGVVIEALDFALSSVSENSVLKGAEIKLNQINAIAKCSDCDMEFKPDDVFTLCPSCGSIKSDFIKGGDLKVISLNVE